MYSEGCEHTQPTLSLVRSVAKEMKLDIDLEMIPIDSDARARDLGFVGSPTVRVNGKDIGSDASPKATSAFS